MKDRIVEFPHRYQLDLVEGESDVYDLTPVTGTVTEVGTPLNKASLLQESTQTALGISSDPNITIDDVLVFLATQQTTVNAGKLNSYSSGNANGNIPISNGTVCTNLNADKVDGCNISTSTSLGTSNVLLPTQNAVKVYTDNKVGNFLNDNYIEKMTTAFTVGLTWEDVNLNTLYGIGANKFVFIVASHGLSGDRYAGIRQNGSSDERRFEVAPFGSLLFVTKTDASGIIEARAETTSVDFNIVGII